MEIARVVEEPSRHEKNGGRLVRIIECLAEVKKFKERVCNVLMNPFLTEKACELVEREASDFQPDNRSEDTQLEELCKRGCGEQVGRLQMGDKHLGGFERELVVVEVAKEFNLGLRDEHSAHYCCEVPMDLPC